GQPRHTAYLHLNAFNISYAIGDTVSTLDTIGYMGKSGVGINTVHCHFEYYKNLSGTSIDKDKAKNPMEILPYTNSNAYSISFGTSNDSSSVLVAVPDTEPDLDGITVHGSSATRTIAFNARTGIDPADNDNPRYNGVLIEPWTFTTDSSIQRLRFWVKQSETGSIDSVTVTDVNGASLTVSNSSSGARYAVSTGNWDASIWAASPGGAAGSASVPASGNNVTINTGVTVTVNIAPAECRSVSFAAATSKLALAGGSALNVYGNFTLFSTSHSAFSSWASGAKLRFKGSAHQVISGWDNASSVTVNTTLMEVEVDKSGDTVRTPGTDMKLALGTSLTVIAGTFMLDSTDDVNGKSFNGSSSAKPAILVQSGGQFVQRGGAHHLRAGTSGSNPVGKVVVYGVAQFASSSSLGVSVDSVTVESGGTLLLNSFSNSQPNNAAFNRIDVKSGAVLINNSTVNFWNASTTVNLSFGGIYKVGASTTVMPPSFNNNGKVQYARSAGDGAQTVVDMDYASLSIASTGMKSWSLATGRNITDTLEIQNGTLSLTSSGQSLTVHDVLSLQSDTVKTGTNTLTLGTSVSSRGTLLQTNGMIAGNFRRWFADAVTDSTLFPIGASGKSRTAAVRFTSAPSSGGTLTASFSGTAPGSNGLPLNDGGTQIVNVSTDGYWTLTAGNGLSGGIYSIALTAPGILGISDRSSLRVLKRPAASPWTMNGSHAIGVGTNEAPTVRRTGMSGFSEFAIGAAEDNPMSVEMQQLEAVADRFSVILKWETAAEISNVGFDIERMGETEGTDGWVAVGFVEGNGTTNVPQRYRFDDRVTAGGKYRYRIKQIDTGGTRKILQYITVEVGTMPRRLMLFQNYPNPFNPSTTVDFTTPKDGPAVVQVFNAVGQLVAELFRGQARGGWLYQTRFDAGMLPSGVYFVRLDASGASMMRKILFLK
nr:T9SS type A sorting domain-containing protein [Bacteroidota bacterium]